MTATCTLIRRDTGMPIGRPDTFAYNVEYPFDGWRNIAWQVRNWIAVEVAPYWRPDTLRMAWTADDPHLDAALFGVAVSWFGEDGVV